MKKKKRYNNIPSYRLGGGKWFSGFGNQDSGTGQFMSNYGTAINQGAEATLGLIGDKRDRFSGIQERTKSKYSRDVSNVDTAVGTASQFTSTGGKFTELGKTGGEKFKRVFGEDTYLGQMGGDSLKYSAAGAEIGNSIFPVVGGIVGGAAGGVGGLVSGYFGKKDYDREVKKQYTQERLDTIKAGEENYAQAINMGYSPKGYKYANYYAYGGKPKKQLMYNYGGGINPEYEVERDEVVQGQNVNLEEGQQLSSDMMLVGGDTHENGGTMGEGGDRVFSERLKITPRLHRIMKIEGMNMNKNSSYADVAKRLGKIKGKFEEKLNSNNIVSVNTANRMLNRIDSMTEDTYNEQEDSKIEKVMAKGGYIMKYASGGSPSGIYIKPSKRGTFTAAAKSRGMGVQEFASQVMSNKENYSPAMVKKANFARNAAKWQHADGGDIYSFLSKRRKYSSSSELAKDLEREGINENDFLNFLDKSSTKTGNRNSSKRYGNIGNMTLSSYRNYIDKSNETFPYKESGIYPSSISTPSEATIDLENRNTISNVPTYSTRDINTSTPAEATVDLEKRDLGRYSGGRNSKFLSFLNKNQGNILNFTNYLLNERDINKLRTRFDPRYLSTPRYSYVDRSRLPKYEANVAFRNTAKAIEGASSQNVNTNRQALFGTYLDRLNRINQGENLRRDTYDEGYTRRLEDVNARNAEIANQANLMNLEAENQIVGLRGRNRANLISGYLEDLNRRDRMDLDRYMAELNTRGRGRGIAERNDLYGNEYYGYPNRKYGGRLNTYC